VAGKMSLRFATLSALWCHLLYLSSSHILTLSLSLSLSPNPGLYSRQS
jgi:hypothetical protein